MGKAEWGADPDFFGPRHAYREQRLRAWLERARPAPGLHLECAAGVGSLSVALARAGRTVVAADASLRSLAVVIGRARVAGCGGRVAAVVADITRLPFRDASFSSATCAETLEHIEHDGVAVGELHRVLTAGAPLVGSVPAGPRQWSAWDDWAGHRRRYTAAAMRSLLAAAGFSARVTTWGWPLLRLYDGLFLQRVNRRRLESDAPLDGDPGLRAVAGLGRLAWLVRLVRLAFALDRPFDGSPWGVGLLFEGRK